jgi:hypothetical protein
MKFPYMVDLQVLLRDSTSCISNLFMRVMLFFFLKCYQLVSYLLSFFKEGVGSPVCVVVDVAAAIVAVVVFLLVVVVGGKGCLCLRSGIVLINHVPV